MSLPEPPPDWGTDEISKFIDLARNNAYATFANLKPDYQSLVSIDEAFRRIIDNLLNTREWFAAFFLLGSHSVFRSATQLSISCQLRESYPLLRSCLEYALYGFHISRHPDSREIWLSRHGSKNNKEKVRDEFRIGRLLNELDRESASDGKVARNLYDRTIDYGAHPNERALMQSLKMIKDDKGIDLNISYLSDDSPASRLALRTTAQVGVCVLEIFRLVFKERYDLLGLTEVLVLLRRGQ